MTDSPATAPAAAFADHDAYEPTDSDDGFRLTTTAFDATVTLPADGTQYELVVRAPTLEAATVDPVGTAVAVGWFDTLKQRLGDATAATRRDVDLAAFGVAEDGDDVVVRYEFEEDSPAAAARVAKTFAEYVEGTYVEGVIPGYEYEGPVADLIGQASGQGSEAEAGGTPL